MILEKFMQIRILDNKLLRYEITIIYWLRIINDLKLVN